MAVNKTGLFFTDSRVHFAAGSGKRVTAAALATRSRSMHHVAATIATNLCALRREILTRTNVRPTAGSYLKNAEAFCLNEMCDNNVGHEKSFQPRTKNRVSHTATA